jgi:hypothetical protein
MLPDRTGLLRNLPDPSGGETLLKMTAKVRHPYATGIALSLSSEALTSLGISQLQVAQFLLRELGKSTFFSKSP